MFGLGWLERRSSLHIKEKMQNNVGSCDVDGGVKKKGGGRRAECP